MVKNVDYKKNEIVQKKVISDVFLILFYFTWYLLSKFVVEARESPNLHPIKLICLLSQFFFMSLPDPVFYFLKNYQNMPRPIVTSPDWSCDLGQFHPLTLIAPYVFFRGKQKAG